MPSAHAKLSPSASERWISCPASIRMGIQLEKEGHEEKESVYAREGTAAHALGEIKARHMILKSLTGDQYEESHVAWLEEFGDVLSLPGVDLQEMEEHTDAYASLIQERMYEYENSYLMLEQRLDTGVPTCWGTSDTVIVSPLHVEIIDFKYGAGVFVSARGNPQLRLYAAGAMDMYGDILGDTEIILITVHQPRMRNVSTEKMTPEELKEWRDSIIPIAESALGDDAEFGPSEEACRWCPASGRCRAQLEEVFKDDFEEDPGHMSPEDVSQTIPRIKMIKDWLAAFEVSALNMAYSEGRDIPGFKVVLSGGQRSVVDPSGAEQVLLASGYERAQIGKIGDFKMNGIGDLEKLLKKEFKALLEDPGFVRKGEGRPSLVPESDKRPAVNRNGEAAKVFGEETK